MIMRDNNDFEAPKPIAEVLIHWNRAFGICLEFVFGEISKKNLLPYFTNTIKKSIHESILGLRTRK
jgi:hypothetical protein